MPRKSEKQKKEDRLKILKSCSKKRQEIKLKSFPTLKSICIKEINKMKFFPDEIKNLPEEILVNLLAEKISSIKNT